MPAHGADAVVVEAALSSTVGRQTAFMTHVAYLVSQISQLFMMQILVVNVLVEHFLVYFIIVPYHIVVASCPFLTMLLCKAVSIGERRVEVILRFDIVSSYFVRPIQHNSHVGASEVR